MACSSSPPEPVGLVFKSPLCPARLAPSWRPLLPYCLSSVAGRSINGSIASLSNRHDSAARLSDDERAVEQPAQAVGSRRDRRGQTSALACRSLAGALRALGDIGFEIGSGRKA